MALSNEERLEISESLLQVFLSRDNEGRQAVFDYLRDLDPKRSSNRAYLLQLISGEACDELLSKEERLALSLRILYFYIGGEEMYLCQVRPSVIKLARRIGIPNHKAAEFALDLIMGILEEELDDLIDETADYA